MEKGGVASEVWADLNVLGIGVSWILRKLALYKTMKVEAVRQLLGQSSVTATSHYWNVTEKNATNLAKMISV